MLVERCRPTWRLWAGIFVIALGLLAISGQIDVPSTRAAGPFTVDDTADAALQDSAGTTCVSTNGGSCTLRAAIEAANNAGGATTINLPAGTYNLSSELQIGTFPSGQSSYDVQIVGADAATTIVKQTAASTRVFNLDPSVAGNVAVSFTGITITGGVGTGFGGGGILGGGDSSDSLTITSCTINGNTTAGQNSAAGINWGAGGNLTIIDSAFSDNSTLQAPAGAINFITQPANPGVLTITGSTFSNNIAGASSTGTKGGALVITVGSGSSATINDTTFSGNQALSLAGAFQGQGGAIFARGPVSVTGSTFINNSAQQASGGSSQGGAIYVESGAFNLSFSRLVGNSAAEGAAIYRDTSGDATVSANNNWWGSNAGPGTALSNVTVSTWLALQTTASPTAVNPSQTATVTADLTHDQNGNAVTGGHVPDGIPATFSATLGTISPTSATTSNGQATSTFTAGTTGGSGSASATVDNQTIPATILVNQPPAITSSSTTTFVVGTAGSFTVQATGQPTPAISETGSLPAGVTLTDNGDGTATLSGTPAAGSGGSYPITLKASNGIGADATQSFTLTVNEAPAITSTDSTTFVAGTAGTFTITATGFPTPTLSLTGSLPSGVTFTNSGDGTATLSGTATAGATGSYPFTITAQNGIGSNAIQNFTLTIGQAPAITSAASTVFTPGTPGAFTVTTTGFPAPSISESGALPTGVTLTDNGDGTATLSGTPASGAAGDYPLTFTATNGIDPDATQSFTLSVGQAPTITNADHATFEVGQSGSFTVTTTGAPSPTLTEVGALPTGVTFTDNSDGTATISGTPVTGTEAVYPITITADNGIGSPATQTFTLTVGIAPAITSTGTTTFTAGTSGTFTVTATGFPTPTLTESGTLPSGVSFTDKGDGSATLSGTPAAGTGGSYALTLTAGNGVGTDAPQSFTLIVDEAATFTSSNSVTFTVGTAGSFTVTTGGHPKPTISETGALPSGVTFSDNGDGTATLAGTPEAGTGGTYTLNLTTRNGVGDDATQQFTFTVNEAASITSVDATTFLVGMPGTFTVTTGGFPLPAISENGALPSGVAFIDNGDGTATLSGTPAAGTQATYPLIIAASNGVGANASQSFSFTVAQPPAVTSADTTTFTVGAAGEFTVTTDGFPAPTLSEDGVLPSGVAFVDNGDGTATLSGTPAAGSGGSYQLTITASNGIGSGAMQSFTLDVNEAPAITSATSATLTVDTEGSFTVTSSGFPVPAVSESGTLPGGVTFTSNSDGTGTLQGTPAAGSGGNYDLTFTASNGVGEDATQSFTLTINEAPAITSANQATFTMGTSGSFAVTTTGFPIPGITETGALPAGIALVDNGNGTATIGGTPTPGTGGTYELSLKAHNGVGADASQAFTLTVNEAPGITSLDDTTFTVGSAGTFRVTTSGHPAAAISERGDLPSGVTFVDNGDGSATLSGTPASGTGGIYSLTLTARNGIGSDAVQQFTLTVDEAPAITSADQTAFQIAVAGSFTVTATGFPTPTITETGPLPSGVTFVDNGDGTGTLAGTPALGTSGTYNLTLTAHNDVGSDATQNFTLTVGMLDTTTTVEDAVAEVGATSVDLHASVTNEIGPIVNEGTVTFVVRDGQGNPVGSPTDGAVSAGAATATFAIPANTPAGSYTVTASYTDGASFNPSEDTGTLTISYPIKSLYDPNQPIRHGLWAFIRIELTDAQGRNLSNAQTSVTALNIAPADQPWNGQEGNFQRPFQYSRSLAPGGGGYQILFNTGSLAPGTYTLYYRVEGDPVIHSATFIVA